LIFPTAQSARVRPHAWRGRAWQIPDSDFLFAFDSPARPSSEGSDRAWRAFTLGSLQVRLSRAFAAYAAEPTIAEKKKKSV
jgi:hypothetical protein